MTLFRHRSARESLPDARLSTLDALHTAPPSLNVERSALCDRLSSPAFTLVETALALLAISIGLLGIFGLAHHGLRNAGNTENETRCALLADTFFQTLKAKNDELAAKKTPLYDWWVYWFGVISRANTPALLYLPPIPEIHNGSDSLAIYAGTHSLGDSSSVTTEVKWNPTYTLTFTPAFSESDLANFASLYAVYERAQIDVTLMLQPGRLQSGEPTRSYSYAITYAGGLP